MWTPTVWLESPKQLVAALAGTLVVLLLWLLRRRPWRGARTRYPVVLAHGVMGFSAVGIGKLKQTYFRGVPEHLRGLGVTVFHPRVPAVSSVAERAHDLAAAIRDIPARRVNIIAHSMGGIDARYAIAHLGIADRVASLTTIGTPHRGTPIADVGTNLLGEKLGLRRLLSTVGLKMEAFYDLTTERMRVFNREVRNVRGVRYLSVVATAGRNGQAVFPLLHPMLTYLDQHGGPSDGLVPTASQRWGRVVARVEADHWGQIGWSPHFDAPPFYEGLLRKLRAKGL